MIKLVFSDMDGTLLDANGQMPPEFDAVMAELRARGVVFAPASGRQYYECDIDTLHEDSRGAKRIVFSSDGLIYYTEDHYESFDLLYGEP